jgi:hypothetical protein
MLGGKVISESVVLRLEVRGSELSYEDFLSLVFNSLRKNFVFSLEDFDVQLCNLDKLFLDGKLLLLGEGVGQ